jgi:CRP-like cAMP-binding protein
VIAAVMTIEEEILFFDRIHIFHQLGLAALRILAISAESQNVSAGYVLFTAGEAADCAYVIRRGSLSLHPERADDAEVVAGPGTLLGETALLIETRRPATARAREDSTVLRISRSMFLRMLEGYPEAAEKLRRLFVARADQWGRDIANVRGVLAGASGSSDDAAP